MDKWSGKTVGTSPAVNDFNQETDAIRAKNTIAFEVKFSTINFSRRECIAK